MKYAYYICLHPTNDTIFPLNSQYTQLLACQHFPYQTHLAKCVHSIYKPHPTSIKYLYSEGKLSLSCQLRTIKNNQALRQNKLFIDKASSKILSDAARQQSLYSVRNTDTLQLKQCMTPTLLIFKHLHNQMTEILLIQHQVFSP